MPFPRRKITKKTASKQRFQKKSSRRPSSIKKMVRSEIARTVENKTKQAFNYGKNVYGSADTNFPDNVIELGPSTVMVVQQGTSQGTRIGNRIKTKSLIFKGTLVPQPYQASNLSPQPVQIAMWIFYDRTDPVALPQVSTNFFQDGSSSKGFQNDLTDLWSPVNTDRYRVLAKKTFKLGFGAYEGTGISASYQAYHNNDFKLNCNFSFDLTKHYPQIVKFDDNSSTPTTRGLFCLIVPFYGNGGAIANGQITVGMQYMQSYVYEDA